VYLTLIDNQNVCGQGTVQAAPIAGRIATEDGQFIEDVEVELSTDGVIGFPFNQMSTPSGDYAFYNNPMYLDYEVAGAKNDNYMNGVSTLDLVLIQKHLLGIASLNSPYKVIAADVNGDANVSAIDLIELRKLILGIYLELPTNDSWRFVDAYQTWANNLSPFPFTEVLDVNYLTTSMMNEDFVGVKIGDVNNTVIVSFDENADNRTDGQFDFVVDQQAYKNGDRVVVEFKGSDALDLIGFQFTMTAKSMNLLNVNAGALNVTMDNFAVHNEQIVSSWNEVSSKDISKDEVLFTMEFEAQKSGLISDLFYFNNAIASSEIYSAEGNTIEELGLQVRNGEELTEQFKLFQNEPNPFLNQTVIGFELPSASIATINVYDVTGKVIKSITNDYAKGYNQVVVIYYQLESGSFSETMKMIVIE